MTVRQPSFTEYLLTLTPRQGPYMKPTDTLWTTGLALKAS